MRSSRLIALAITMTLAACGGGGAAPLTGGGGGETAGQLASFAISHPDGAVTVGDTMIMEVAARDAAGQPLTGGQPQFTSSDVAVATVDAAGVVRGLKAGASTITGSLTMGGVTKTATYGIAVLAAPAPPPATPPTTPPTTPPPAAPSTATVQGVEDAFSPSAVTVAAGGTVTWTMVDEEHDVTWTGAAPTGGNIGRIDRGQSVSRTFPGAGTFAYTCARHDGKHGGTVAVQGTAQAVFTSVQITPASSTVAVGATVQLTATPLDQAGRAMPGLPAATWTTSDATKATVSATGVVSGVAAGTATVTARITQAGVTREAAATVTVGGTTTPPAPPAAPTTATVTTPGTTFSPANVTIATGGSVTWQFTGSTRHNVTFSGTAPTGGNIPDTDAGGSASRTFGAAGTYSYTCTRHAGMNGTVVVQP
ncbi:MAG TPA: Ig-like domain-containing protein [Longimicrobium sp.]|nr:Ig-like domain-containing protein [Longimicrobium sp.]